MKHIKKFEGFNYTSIDETHWSNNPDNSEDEITVGKLIDMLKGYDPNQPVRLGYSGYSNQEIKNVTTNEEGFRDDNDEWVEYPIVQINSK